MDINKWLIDKLIETSTIGNEIIKKFYNNNKIILKLSTYYETEYICYQLLGKLKNNPNVLKIYGNIECYKKNKYLEKLNIKNYNNNTNIIFNIIERTDNSIILSELSKNNIKLSRIKILSLLVQGLYTIYNMFYIFGILYNNFSDDNIIIKLCNENKSIKYEFDNRHYRFFDNNLNIKCYDKYFVETNGVQLYIIGFDKVTFYHKYFININKIYKHPIDSAYEFINKICKKYDPFIYKTCKEFYKTKGKYLINASNKFIEIYELDNREQNNNLMIEKISLHYKIWIKELFKKFPELNNKNYGEII
jgi:hypothetical protein